MDMIKFGQVGGRRKEGATSDFISSLQFLFVENGHFVLSDIHGDRTLSTVHTSIQ